jgi:hypothetical protein
LPTFAVVSGPCTVTSGGSCFRSANYPNHYGDNEQCEITVLATVGFARATTFETESAAYDYLTIGSTTNPCLFRDFMLKWSISKTGSGQP